MSPTKWSFPERSGRGVGFLCYGAWNDKPFKLQFFRIRGNHGVAEQTSSRAGRRPYLGTVPLCSSDSRPSAQSVMKKSWTREELYELVWATPVSTLAAEVGMSDRGIGKMCERLDVPTPPRGYWAKHAAGQKVPTAPPLPIVQQTEVVEPQRQRPVKPRPRKRDRPSAAQQTRTPRLWTPHRLDHAEPFDEEDTSARSSASDGARRNRQPAFASVSLDDMISHNSVQECYPWLSAQIINRWRRKRLIRYFRGKGCVLYSKTELDRALESEMRIDDPPEPRQRPPWTPRERDKAISAVVTEEQSLRLISKGGVLSADQVEQINRKRQEVDLGPTTSEPRLPPDRTKHSQRNTTARAPRGNKTKSVD